MVFMIVCHDKNYVKNIMSTPALPLNENHPFLSRQDAVLSLSKLFKCCWQ